MFLSRNTINTIRFQRGVSMAFLLFVMIIISLLVAGMVKMNSNSTITNAIQTVSTRALLAAESGAQLQGMAIFQMGGGTTCANVDYTFSTPGLNACSASTTCNVTSINGTNYFEVTSQGQCNAGSPAQATRTIRVRMQGIN